LLKTTSHQNYRRNWNQDANNTKGGLQPPTSQDASSPFSPVDSLFGELHNVNGASTGRTTDLVGSIGNFKQQQDNGPKEKGQRHIESKLLDLKY
jgi:hypothetical protein